MRPILLDTNAYAAFKKGNEDILQLVQQTEIIGISSIVLGELLSGFDGGNKGNQNRLELQQFLANPRIEFFNVTIDTAHYFSSVYTSLKRKGKPIPANDMWIAAQALEHGIFVCTYDKHFQAIDGIIVVNTIADLAI